LADTTKRLGDAEAELKIKSLDTGDEEEVSAVKKYLLDREKELNAETAKLDKDKADLDERDKESRVKTLVSKYGVDEESISGEPDPEKKALELYAERLTKEKEELGEQTPESIYETATPGSVKKQPKDMSDEEFKTHVEGLKREALSKR